MVHHLEFNFLQMFLFLHASCGTLDTSMQLHTINQCFDRIFLLLFYLKNYMIRVLVVERSVVTFQSHFC